MTWLFKKFYLECYGVENIVNISGPPFTREMKRQNCLILKASVIVYDIINTRHSSHRHLDMENLGSFKEAFLCA